MDYPLYFAGEERGRLCVSQDGLYTVLEAVAESTAEPTRIWVYGAAGSGAYLGLMQPWSGGLYLKRRLSRRELESFPQSIECASDRRPDESAQRPQTESAPVRKSSPEAESAAVNESAEEPELLWLRRPDGSLTAFDGERNLVALPASLRHSPEGAVLRRIDGREYLIFRY